jgi:hypothetical protein
MEKLAALTMRLNELAEPRVRCPSCSEKILAAARRCKYCGEVFSGDDEAPAPTDTADMRKSRTSLPLLAALVLVGGAGGIALGAIAIATHRPAAEVRTQAVAPAMPAAPPALPAPQPTAESCDAPEVLASIARGLQELQHLPERPVPRDRFVDLEMLARTDHGVECGVTLAAGPRSDDIRAGYYHVEYRNQEGPDDKPAVRPAR